MIKIGYWLQPKEEVFFDRYDNNESVIGEWFCKINLQNHPIEYTELYVDRSNQIKIFGQGIGNVVTFEKVAYDGFENLRFIICSDMFDENDLKIQINNKFIITDEFDYIKKIKR